MLCCTTFDTKQALKKILATLIIITSKKDDDFKAIGE